MCAEYARPWRAGKVLLWGLLRRMLFAGFIFEHFFLRVIEMLDFCEENKSKCCKASILS